VEHVIVTTTFDASLGSRSDEGYHSMGGDSIAVFAECACGHRWKLRGVIQITCIDVTRSKP
jgi:hypothetical protein